MEISRKCMHTITKTIDNVSPKSDWGSLSSASVVTSSASVPQGPGLGPIPMSQFGTISRQISRHNSSTTSSASMVSATGTYRRAPSVSSQQPHINGVPAYPQNTGNSDSILFLFINNVGLEMVCFTRWLVRRNRLIWSGETHTYSACWSCSLTPKSMIMWNCKKRSYGSKRYAWASRG